MTGDDPLLGDGGGDQRLSVFVTVGMGPWPFDRLMEAVRPLCVDHDLFVQTGTSEVELPCEQMAFLGYRECLERMESADVVITHAGNSVRLVQRIGKMPMIVAREAARGEMRNDHQVPFAAREGSAGRAVAVGGDAAALAGELVEAVVSRLWAVPGPTLAPAAGESVGALLDALPELGSGSGGVGGPGALGGNPFTRHPTARYAWAFDRLAPCTGDHLELGIGDAVFLRALVERTQLSVTAAEPHAGYLEAARRALPTTRMVQVTGPLPFPDASFDSVSMLDVLEHTPDDRTTLTEVARALRPAGLLVMSVPARHVFTVLDPDNAKFRFPRMHRAVYTARFGRATCEKRFVDDADGLRGDIAWERPAHTNYDPRYLIELLISCGLVPQTRDGANLFWRFLQVPALLLPEFAAPMLDAPLRWDGALFDRANLFLTAVRAG